MNQTDRLRGCLLGLAVGDAVGTTAEFRKRGTFPEITDMVGGGPFNLNPGEWTDDTSMALCLAASLIESGGFNARDQMSRYYKWWRSGYMSSNGSCFDIGFTTQFALKNYENTGDPFSGLTGDRNAGNGCLMRLAPVPIYFYPDIEKIIHYCGESSRTTHALQVCIDACRYFGLILYRALKGEGKKIILSPPEIDVFESDDLTGISQGSYFDKTEDQIHGTGYVINCLESALWCFYTTNSFEEAILKAANLGDDADTTAAVCGQVAGAYYGESGIPQHWHDKLAKVDMIRDLAKALRA